MRQAAVCAGIRVAERAPITVRRPASLFCLCVALAATASATADPELTVKISGATLHVQLDAERFQAGTPAILDWVRRAAGIVSGYYGRFPAADVRLRLQSEPGAGVQGGQTFGAPAALIRIRAGQEVTPAQLMSDWVLVHEMTHLALPDTGEEHAWLSEGIATYVEGVARVQAGNRAETDVWAEELGSMPRGLPQEGDRGLDRTHTWGRTYWGGAMFCLLADVDIRRRTQLRFGLQDALRAVLVASGGLASDWPIERVLATGDTAVGTHSLEELYASMKDAAVKPDLPALWHELGVTSVDGEVRLDDQAPLAAVRRAIMQPPMASAR
jgi:hypothetical protein